LRLTQEEFIAKAKSIHGDAYDYSEVNYKLSKLKVRIKCNKHGIGFDMSPNQHTSGKKSGCPLCSCSGYSIMQIEWLSFMESYYHIDIQYKHKNGSMKEYHIKGTRWHADGYYKDPHINDKKYMGTIYEFHGDYWHGNPRVYDPEFMHQRRHRKMKTLYKETNYRDNRIKELGYNLVVMWEHDWKLIIKTITQCQRNFRATHSE
jgi:G:T-mismatch repair DNA endonuclease (very short patch repair protein)